MFIPVDCDKLCIYNVIPRKTTSKPIHSKMLQINQNEILKKFFHKRQENKIDLKSSVHGLSSRIENRGRFSELDFYGSISWVIKEASLKFEELKGTKRKKIKLTYLTPKLS